MIQDEILQFLLYPNFSGWLLIIKIIFLGFSLFFIFFTIIALTKTSWFRKAILIDLKEFLTFRPYGLKKFVREWEKIKKRLETGSESETKLALIEADSLLDKALERRGYEGKSLGEKLEKVTVDVLSNLEEVLNVHKIRNNIIHDPTYILNLEEAKKAISIYEKALTDLEAL